MSLLLAFQGAGPPPDDGLLANQALTLPELELELDQDLFIPFNLEDAPVLQPDFISYLLADVEDEPSLFADQGLFVPFNFDDAAQPDIVFNLFTEAEEDVSLEIGETQPYHFEFISDQVQNLSLDQEEPDEIAYPDIPLFQFEDPITISGLDASDTAAEDQYDQQDLYEAAPGVFLQAEDYIQLLLDIEAIDDEVIMGEAQSGPFEPEPPPPPPEPELLPFVTDIYLPDPEPGLSLVNPDEAPPLPPLPGPRKRGRVERISLGNRRFRFIIR
jgi:hypothetical protein